MIDIKERIINLLNTQKPYGLSKGAILNAIYPNRKGNINKTRLALKELVASERLEVRKSGWKKIYRIPISDS